MMGSSRPHKPLEATNLEILHRAKLDPALPFCNTHR